MSRLVCDSLWVAHGGTVVLRNLSLTVDHAEIVALVGPSGSGKTTLLKVIAGLDQPSRGTVRLDDDDITNWPAHKRRIGLVFQEGALFPHLTVGENIGYGLKMSGVARHDRTARIAALLDLIRLPNFEHREVHTLSGGESQRVALARALAPEPRVLLLDEPFASLDEELRIQLAGEVREILRARDTTAVIVTHDAREATRFGDRTITLNELQEPSGTVAGDAVTS